MSSGVVVLSKTSMQEYGISLSSEYTSVIVLGPQHALTRHNICKILNHWTIRKTEEQIIYNRLRISKDIKAVSDLGAYLEETSAVYSQYLDAVKITQLRVLIPYSQP